MMQPNRLDRGRTADIQCGRAPHGMRCLVEAGFVVFALLVLLGGLMLAAAIVAHIAAGADFA